VSLSPILRTLALALGITVMSAALSTAGAQQPQMSADMMKQQADAMVPMIAQMTRVTLQTALDFYAQPATAKALATFTRNYLDALVAAGFTRDEALRIVAAHGMPTLPGAGH
jgi:hypothetical protein